MADSYSPYVSTPCRFLNRPAPATLHETGIGRATPLWVWPLH